MAATPTRAVRLDAGGYGISWNDDLDLSAYELWTKGITIEKSVEHHAGSAG